MMRDHWSVLAVGVVLLASACSSGTESTTSTITTTAPASEATTTVATTPAVGLDELCSPSLTVSGLDLDTAGAIPTSEGGTLGTSGAQDLLGDLVDPTLTFCGLDASLTARNIIDASEAAFASGDPDEAAAILRGLLDADGQAWMPWSGEGVLAAGAGADDTQRVTDLFKAAGAAYRQGNDELGDEIADQARDLAIDVATTKAQETNEPAVLLTLAAQAQLLGADDVADIAISKAQQVLEKDLDGLTEGDPALGTPPYDPCTVSPEEAKDYADAAGRVALLGGGDERFDDAVERIQTTWERMHDYQLVAEECGNMVFTAIDEVPGWDGLIELELRTCDASVWTGAMTIDVTLSAGGGSGRQTGVADAKVVLELGQPQGSGEIQMDRTITFSAAGESVDVENSLDGTITFGVDAANATAEAVIEFPSSTETVSAGGMSFSMPVEGMRSEFSGTLSHDGDCG